MDDPLSNSHKKRDLPEPTTAERNEQMQKRLDKLVEKVVDEPAIRRKKPLGKRFKEIFFGGDSKSVTTYIMMDVLIPAAKDMVADAASQGVERMLFGDDHHYGRRGGRRGGRNAAQRNPVNYGSYTNSYANRYSSRDDRPPFPPNDRRQMSRKSRANHEFDEIILATRAEGEEVLDRLYTLLDKYETATVADLYEMVGLTSEYTDDKWGWEDLRGAGIRRVREGYLLELPRPEPLN